MANLQKHPIQLKRIVIQELAFKVNTDSPEIEAAFNFVGRHKFDEETKIISVNIRASFGEDQALSKYTVIVDILGLFEIDTERFNVSLIDEWAKKNAPYILHPYLRENIYSLTIHAGIQPLLLPLVQIPTTRETGTKKTTEQNKEKVKS